MLYSIKRLVKVSRCRIKCKSFFRQPGHYHQKKGNRKYIFRSPFSQQQEVAKILCNLGLLNII